MAKIGINLNAIKEKQPLAPGMYTFTVRKSVYEPTKDQTSNNISLELVPQESPTDIVFHRFSMKEGALTANSPSMSLKKFLDLVNIPYGEDFDSDALFGLTFRGTIKHEPYNGRVQPRLDTVLGR